MYRFYVDESDVNEALGEITLKEEDYNHIRNVLRIKLGEKIVVCDGACHDYYCSVKELGSGKDPVIAGIERMELSKNELKPRIVLYQGFPKKDKMELIIQKAVELGAAEVVPVMTRRTIVKLEDPKKEAKKIARMNEIAKAAAMQSERGVIPQVASPVSFKSIIKEIGDKIKASGNSDSPKVFGIIPYENADGMEASRKLFKSIADACKEGGEIAIFIGPEGGFDPEEVQLALDNGITPVTLGHRILRTETAGFCIISAFMLMLDED